MDHHGDEKYLHGSLKCLLDIHPFAHYGLV